MKVMIRLSGCNGMNRNACAYETNAKPSTNTNTPTTVLIRKTATVGTQITTDKDNSHGNNNEQRDGYHHQDNKKQNSDGKYKEIL